MLGASLLPFQHTSGVRSSLSGTVTAVLHMLVRIEKTAVLHTVVRFKTQPCKQSVAAILQTLIPYVQQVVTSLRIVGISWRFRVILAVVGIYAGCWHVGKTLCKLWPGLECTISCCQTLLMQSTGTSAAQEALASWSQMPRSK